MTNKDIDFVEKLFGEKNIWYLKFREKIKWHDRHGQQEGEIMGPMSLCDVRSHLYGAEQQDVPDEMMSIVIDWTELKKLVK